MIINIFILFLGLSLLLGGGSLLVRGASALARDLGVSSLVIGLTVVAFGTSAPELAINLIAAVQGNPEISFGNIIGSNIANIGLIISIAALFRPLTIESVIITREIPMMVLATLLALVLGADTILHELPNSFDRSDGIVLLLIFCVFLYYTIGDVIRRRRTDPFIQQAKELSEKSLKKTIFNVWILLGGLACLIIGGKLTVDSGVKIAEALNVPRVVISLTIIAVGTSLPELATSIIATWKGQTDLAIGNVVGSNIFNLLLVNGLCSTLRPIPVPIHGGLIDLFMMTFLSLLLLPISVTDKNKIVRWEGAVLLFIYCGFSLFRVILS
ncbi:MAG: calcium/sodium antiporter [Candidatus Dadabacteria bacterium]|nr:calcium/sodium antiporter [Candidatus Dadabacteria bacterium]NIT13348.1 calcium/sodium antiporter [Candidatus Dadabacteria bacterium]